MARPRPRSLVIGGLLAVLVLLVIAAVWVGVRGWTAKGELEQAQGLVADLQDAAGEGDYGLAASVFDDIAGHASRARDLTGDPIWRGAEVLPSVGVNLTALRELTAVIDDTMTAAEPLVGLVGEVGAEGLKPQDGALPIATISQVADEITPLAEELTVLAARLDAVRTEDAVAQLGEAKEMLAEVIGPAASALTEAAPVVRAVPALLGADSPRTYVVMFLNNAELRSLGGGPLAFVELSVDEGAIELGSVIPAADGGFSAHAEPIIPIPEGFETVLPGVLGRFISDATLRPSAVTAAQIVEAEWEHAFGKEIDGVFSLDAGALQLLLQVVGPVPISTGDVVSADTVLPLLFNEVYFRYDSGVRAVDDAQQGLVYAETVAGTFSRLMSGDYDLREMYDALSAAAEGRHFSLWFPDADDREALAVTPFLAQDLLESTATTDVVGLYLNGLVGSKLDYYLLSTVTTGSATCSADGRQVHRVTLDLTNSLDPALVPDLSGSITGGTHPTLNLPTGAERIALFVYLPKGSTLLSASVDGAPVEVTGQQDSGHPVQVVWLVVAPGADRQASIDVLVGDPGSRDLVVDVTPTIQGTVRAEAPLECDTVALP
ncbi:DUF4012 domain-containing protein [Actinotalea sp.]|uniref:DUF4012 domain-containing protein n=1 Tax=Actinotalea sp. TaxID=1872145 RepID=UPI003567B874